MHCPLLCRRILSWKVLLIAIVFLLICLGIVVPRAIQYYSPVIADQSAEHEYAYQTSATSPKRTVPLSVVVPCASEDHAYLATLLESIAKQTVYPQEVMLVLNLYKQEGFEEGRLDLWNPAHQVEVQKLLRSAQSGTAKKPLYVQDVLSTRQPVQKSLSEIPKVSIFKRNGRREIGDNRVFGANATTSGLVSFFDCDDYMHPQRLEYLYRTFLENPELDALLHGYRYESVKDFLKLISNFTHPLPYLDEMNQTFPPWPYETLHERLPVARFKDFPGGEPDNIRRPTWFFPHGMNLEGYKELGVAAHNGWLTVKKKILETIPYPADNPGHGEDSVYNYRLLKNKVNFNMLTITLGLFLRQRP